MISNGRSFAWETVFSHESRLEIMASAKRHGYLIHLFYITTKNPDVNVARVRTRENLIDAGEPNLQADGAGGGRIVSSDHGHPDPRSPVLADHSGRVGTDRV